MPLAAHNWRGGPRLAARLAPIIRPRARSGVRRPRASVRRGRNCPGTNDDRITLALGRVAYL